MAFVWTIQFVYDSSFFRKPMSKYMVRVYSKHISTSIYWLYIFTTKLTFVFGLLDKGYNEYMIRRIWEERTVLLTIREEFINAEMSINYILNSFNLNHRVFVCIQICDLNRSTFATERLSTGLAYCIMRGYMIRTPPQLFETSCYFAVKKILDFRQELPCRRSATLILLDT